MTHITEQYCIICYHYTVHRNGICIHCKYNINEDTRIRAWNSMDLFDKLNDLRQRVEDLEKESKYENS